MDIDPYALRIGIIQFIVLVCSLTLHEWGHAYVADRLGDDTPRREGRVTLNPLPHIDPMGTILIPALGMFGMFGRLGIIGWAKPVYTNPSNFRRGYFDQALVTLAGPAMNVALATVGTICAVVAGRFSLPVVDLFQIVIELNVMLAVFNLLPIPPLDGSKFLIYLGAVREETYMRMSMFGGIVLLVLINIPVFRSLLGRLIEIGYVPFVLLAQVLARLIS